MKTVLREAKQILDEKGWIKGDYKNLDVPDLPMGFCLVGALSEVLLGGRMEAESVGCVEAEILLEVIAEQFPDRKGTYGDIPTFNDHEDTTRADIDLVLEKAIAKADEIVT